MDDTNVVTSAPIIHNLGNQPDKTGFSYQKFALFLILVIIFGGGTGFLVSKLPLTKTPTTSGAKATSSAGIPDKKTFKDSAEGILKEGGVDGEGNFHLERPGGASQNVYLTSTTADLSLYIGRKVRVWGETFTAEHAGWLMDVGLVELLQ